jgi:hypothetical protein
MEYPASLGDVSQEMHHHPSIRNGIHPSLNLEPISTKLSPQFQTPFYHDEFSYHLFVASRPRGGDPSSYLLA